MLNQVVLVGRIYGELEKKVIDDKVFVEMTLSCQRPYKNEEGEYTTGLVPVTLFYPIAKSTLEYCKTGDIVGVKGRIENNNNGINIIAEKVTFLSSKAQD